MNILWLGTYSSINTFGRNAIFFSEHCVSYELH